MKAALPENEAERLRALQQTGLLDTPPEDDFDSLVRLASVICQTPIATVTLVDADRQWFKAKVGLQGQEDPRDVAFCAHTILKHDLFEVPDTLVDPRFADNPLVVGDPGIRFYAGVPLETTDGLRLGSLCVIDRSPRELTAAQREALNLLAQQASKQINLRRQQHTLEQAIAKGTMVEQELRTSQGLFHAFMDNSPFVSFMKDAEGRLVYYNQRFAERFHIERETWLGKLDAELWPPAIAANLRANDLAVLRQWQTLVVEEQADPSKDNPVLWRSYKFPFKDLDSREYVAGFAMDITEDKQNQRQLEAYQKALEAANEKLLTLAVTDSLTNLPNRRAFEAGLQHEFAISRRYGQPLSLMILDIDNFKSFNDSYGHAEGDRVLQCVAAVIAKSFRSTDLVARYGGEEFAVILPNTPKQSAAESAERLRAAIADCELHDHSITASIGLATLDLASATKADFVRRADSALYQAKRDGKNRVSLSR